MSKIRVRAHFRDDDSDIDLTVFSGQDAEGNAYSYAAECYKQGYVIETYGDRSYYTPIADVEYLTVEAVE